LWLKKLPSSDFFAFQSRIATGAGCHWLGLAFARQSTTVS
jgi:hypothetical protein